MNNQPNKASFKFYLDGILCVGVAKIESKEEMITGKICPFFEYTGEKIATIDMYQK